MTKTFFIFFQNLNFGVDIALFSVIIPFVAASVAHLVERHLAKVEVASSSLVTRSKWKDTTYVVSFFLNFRAQPLSLQGRPVVPYSALW